MHNPLPDNFATPPIVDRDTYEAQVGALRQREKAHTKEGDAIAAARRRLPMIEVDGAVQLTGENGATSLLDAFEGRRMLLAYYFMWHPGHDAAGQCEGCTFFTTQVRELSAMHARDVTYITIAQGQWDESRRYYGFMDWKMPWYAGPKESLEALLPGRRIGMMHLVSYLRQGSRVFETWWTTRRGVESMDNSYRLLDLTVYGRQEETEDSPDGWPKRSAGKQCMRINGRPTSQWSRLEAGRSDDLGTGGDR